ncbi:hypothetical protein BZG36_03949 [Bifiguratus adelaidae]|uniref:NADP-dependent oxidoreductase domain-containing protein n=1 Tax=Bifiguratus adelaidae TaxID=1938954 RepID=A0A261XZT3_9FUNG|nr:hypothetical protein BZG36_03949 [Bifiguratus adelaidae]
MSSQPLSARAPDWQELVSECVSLVSVTIVSSLFGAKLAAGVEWKSLPYSKGLVLSLYAFVWTFVTSSCLLVSTNDGNIISCSLSILACDVFYAGSKIITYLWLVEKVWVVQAVKTHRLRTPLYILNLVLMLPYIGIFILMVMFRISYITDQNTCIIGLQPIASIPLLVYDFRVQSSFVDLQIGLDQISKIAKFTKKILHRESQQTSKPAPWAVSKSPLQVSPISFGAGVFSGNYETVEQLPRIKPVEAVVRALERGINLFDTSPYYGDSEKILGDALKKVSNAYPRSCYYISTKVGRYGYRKCDFDYSSQRVRTSVEESMRRLHTDYIDIVYCHDVEFVDREDVQTALKELFQLKAEGKIGHVGISGYPLPVLSQIAAYQDEIGQPLDVVLSYCHYTLQNSCLAEYIPSFQAQDVKYIFNASPLSMGLLRSWADNVPIWHPAPPECRETVAKCAQIPKAKGIALADLASRYSFDAVKFKPYHLLTGSVVLDHCHLPSPPPEAIDVDGAESSITSTVIGLETPQEVESAYATWSLVQDRQLGIVETSTEELECIQAFRQALGPWKDWSWESPTSNEMA